MKKIILTILISVFLMNSAAYASDKLEFDFSKRKPANAAFRSLLMPGWGQGWNEQPTKAWITFGVFAVSVAGAFYFNNQSEKDYEKYEEAGQVNSRYYDDYESDYQLSQIFTYAAIGTWLYSIIDAYFVCKSQISKPTASFNLLYDQKNDSINLTYTKKF